MMKTKLMITLALLAIIVSACGTGMSEAEMQTAVAQAIETSSAQMTQEAEKIAASQAEDTASDEDLQAAFAALTAQAEELQDLEEQLATINAGPTATNTLSATLPPTNTPYPTATYGLPEGQSYVIAKGNAPLWEKKGENKSEFPIMQKTKPVVRYESGDRFLVWAIPIRADGSLEFYQVVGPIGSGKYVLISDVTLVEQ